MAQKRAFYFFLINYGPQRNIYLCVTGENPHNQFKGLLATNVLTMKTPKGKPRELCPEGIHQATLVSIVDLGEQQPNNPTYSPSRKANFIFEITEPGITKEDGGQFLMKKEYTFSEKSKNLMADMKGWQGLKSLVDVEWDGLLGKSAAVTIVHNASKTTGEIYDNISNISGLMKSVKAFRAKTPLVSFYLEEGEPLDKASFDALPEWTRNTIAKSKEYVAAVELLEAPKGKKSAAKVAAKTPAKKGK